jgi:hypothetical protein
VSNINCGMCGRACAASQVCGGGGTQCVNTQTSNNNCGMCGYACPTSTTCMMGACR